MVKSIDAVKSLNAGRRGVLKKKGAAPTPSAIPSVEEAQTTQLPRKVRDSQSKWGGSMKRRCLAEFQVKCLFLLPHITHVMFCWCEHTNNVGVKVHGDLAMERRSSFSACLSTEMKEWVIVQLDLGLSVQQIMAHHREKVFHMMLQTTGERNDLLTWDMFITHQDVRNLSSKKATETYHLHQNDALNVRMWVETNKDSVFHYTKTCKVGPGALHASNVPFTIGIQTP